MHVLGSCLRMARIKDVNFDNDVNGSLTWLLGPIINNKYLKEVRHSSWHQNLQAAYAVNTILHHDVNTKCLFYIPLVS